MAQANKYVPKNSFAEDVRNNKPSRHTVDVAALDGEFTAIRATANQLVANLALIQRDDGCLKDGVVAPHTLSREVLMLLGQYELLGEWQPHRPYLQGQVVQWDSHLYVCSVAHDAGAVIDLSKFKAFGKACNQSLSGQYLSTYFDDPYFSGSMDNLTASGVYLVFGSGRMEPVLVLEDAQIHVHSGGVSVRFKNADGTWTQWINTGYNTPRTITGDSDNTPVLALNGWEHSHKIDRASINKAGIVQLAGTLTDAEDKAPTPKAAKSYVDAKYADLLRLIGSDDVATAAMAELPAGAVMYFDRETAPTGWLVADGRLVSKQAYPQLFDAIGTRYGGGNTPDEFRLPDFRAEFIRGWDKGRGVDKDRALGSKQDASVGRHRHGVGAFGGYANDDGWFVLGDWSDGDKYDMRWVAGESQERRVVNFPGGVQNGMKTSWPVEQTDSDPHPRNTALLCCIKAMSVNGVGLASETKNGIAKLYQSIGGHQDAVDGALSVAGVKAAINDAAPQPTSAPAAQNNHSVSTRTVGGAAVLLGEPAGWLDFGGKKVPYYD